MQHALIIRIVAIAVSGLGLLIVYWVKRRRFYRRAATGLEGFSNYRKSLFIPFLEKLLTMIGKLLILAGVVAFLSTLA